MSKYGTDNIKNWLEFQGRDRIRRSGTEGAAMNTSNKVLHLSTGSRDSVVLEHLSYNLVSDGPG